MTLTPTLSQRADLDPYLGTGDGEMTKWRGIRAKPVPFELTPWPHLLKRVGENPVSPPSLLKRRGLGG